MKITSNLCPCVCVGVMAHFMFNNVWLPDMLHLNQRTFMESNAGTPRTLTWPKKQTKTNWIHETSYTQFEEIIFTDSYIKTHLVLTMMEIIMNPTEKVIYKESVKNLEMTTT